MFEQSSNCYFVQFSIFREITTFECYCQEVLSGQLNWGVLHTERFWRETAKEMDADDFFIIKHLIEVGLMTMVSEQQRWAQYVLICLNCHYAAGEERGRSSRGHCLLRFGGICTLV